MARSTPPSLIAASVIAFTSATTPISTPGTFTWLTGDVFVVSLINENGSSTFTTPTLAAGPTFSSIVNIGTTNVSCRSQAFAATALSGGGPTAVSCGISPAIDWGAVVYQYRGSDGIGINFSQQTSTKTVSATPTDTHSAFVWGVGDFAAIATTGITLTPTPTTTQAATQVVSHYTAYDGNLNDNATASAQNWGITGGSGTGPFSIAGVEILGTGGSLGPQPKFKAIPFMGRH